MSISFFSYWVDATKEIGPPLLVNEEVTKGQKKIEIAFVLSQYHISLLDDTAHRLTLDSEKDLTNTLISKSYIHMPWKEPKGEREKNEFLFRLPFWSIPFPKTIKTVICF